MRRTLTAITLAIALTACGGSNGDTGTDATTTTEAPATSAP